MASTSRADGVLCGSVARGLSQGTVRGGEETDSWLTRVMAAQHSVPCRVPSIARGAWRCRARAGRGACRPSGEREPPSPACRVRRRPLRRVFRFPGRRPQSQWGQLGHTALSPSSEGAGVAGWPGGSARSARRVTAPAAAGLLVSFERGPVPCGTHGTGVGRRRG